MAKYTLSSLVTGAKKAAGICGFPEKQLYAALGLLPDGKPITTVAEAKKAFESLPITDVMRDVHLRHWIGLCQRYEETKEVLGSCHKETPGRQEVLSKMIQLCSTPRQFSTTEWLVIGENNPMLLRQLYRTAARFYARQEDPAMEGQVACAI